jgi:hypothetical protein
MLADAVAELWSDGIHIMSTYNALFVRKKGTDKQTRTAMLSVYPKAKLEVSGSFVGGVLSDTEWEASETKLAALSAKLATDVFWVTYQNTVGSFIYHHWHNGVHLRTLMYGCLKEGKWDKVEGQAEPWEKECFWDKESLKMCLEEAKSDAERKRITKLWKDGVLIKGSALPVAGDDVAVNAVMEHYEFGWFAEDAV